MGFGGGFGNSEFLPVSIRMQGDWSDSEKTKYQNKVLSTFGSVIHIEFVDGDADIVFHIDQASAEKNFGYSLSDREYGALQYKGEFEYCDAFVRDSDYIPYFIFGCLGNNQAWGRNLGVSSSFSQDTFVEGELYGSSRIEIMSKGRVRGKVTNLAGCLIIQDGGVVEGQCTIVTEEKMKGLLPQKLTKLLPEKTDFQIKELKAPENKEEASKKTG